MRFYKLTIFLSFLLLFMNMKAENMKYSIIPTPKMFSVEDGIFSFPKTSSVKLIGEDKTQLGFSVEKLNNTLKNNGIQATINENNANVTFEIVKESDLKDVPTQFVNEAYKLIIDKNGININAVTYKGIYYGVTSLIQLFERSNNAIPFCTILDYPDMQIRGVSDDISRGQVSTLDNFKKIIENIARYKMNTYMPYMEDVLQLESFPTIGVNRGALTNNEVKELISFAAKNFVEIVPIYQTLGHYENILLQKEFLKYAEFPGAASLDVSNPATYTFLETMLKEVFELFPSVNINIGADESYDVGLGNSKSLVDKSSLAKVHLEHYKKVYAICKKYNKNVWMYSDILLHHPEILDELPKDIVAVDWHYRPDAEYPSTETFDKAGFKYIVSPSVWNFLSPFPTNFNALPNIEYITKDGIKNNSIGMINSNWGDYGAETIKELIYYGYAYSAACAWNINDSELTDFTKNYFTDFFNTSDSQIDEFYTLFSTQLNQFLWHDVFRHPALPFKTPVWWESSANRTTKNSWTLNILPTLKGNIANAKIVAKRNADHIEILQYMVNLNEWFVLKTQTQQLINDLLNNNSSENKLCINLIDKNIETIKKLRDEYKSIWLRYYKPENLNMIEDKYNRLIAYFEETKTNIKNNTLHSPVIESKWIYLSTEKDNLVRNAKFKKSFDINSKVKSAKLQLLGDTYVKLYINGEFIDEIYARRSLSLLVDYGRILYVDITKYLKNGENTIEVVAQNFNNKGNAGFNLFANIITEDGQYELSSNETWWGKDLSNDNSSWQQALTKDYNYIVTEPNFETDRTSWIER